MTKWGLAGLGGLVLTYLGELQREALLGYHCGYSVLVVNGERLTPVALTAEYGVTQTVVDLYLAQFVVLNIFLGGGNGLLYGKSVQVESALADLVGTG